MIVKRAQKEEKGNVQFVEERIKRAARLLKGQEDEEGEGDLKESSDDLVPEEEEEDVGNDEVERQEKIDRLLGDLSESRSKSSFSNPRLTALRQRRLKLLLGEDSDSSSSDSETSGAVLGSIGTSSIPGNPSNQSEVLDGSNPGPSCGLRVGKHESVKQREDSGSPGRGTIERNSSGPDSDTRGYLGLSDLEESSEALPIGTNDGPGGSSEKVHFKKPGSQGVGGRCIRKRSHDED